jgi:hypothetical protein
VRGQEEIKALRFKTKEYGEVTGQMLDELKRFKRLEVREPSRWNQDSQPRSGHICIKAICWARFEDSCDFIIWSRPNRVAGGDQSQKSDRAGEPQGGGAAQKRGGEDEERAGENRGRGTGATRAAARYV